MKVLVVGGGGREHAIVRKLSESPKIDKLYCAPGNGGISGLAECLPYKATDIEGITKYSVENKIDLVMVAPDDPLAMGLVDNLERNGIRAFGPRANAAVIEASKAFSKGLMKKYNIPTAEYEVFDDKDKALNYLNECKLPIVIKADGLALGKGVIIAETREDAEKAVSDMLDGSLFGDSGKKVVIEEFLTGPEVTVLAFTDGKTVVPMVSSQDHKRAYDNDQGPNTGGMGTFSPSRVYTSEIAEECMKVIFQPTIDAMASEGRPFKGIIYYGLMLTEAGPKVIEYNARIGDPETQVILPRLKTDLLEIFEAIIDERLNEINVEWEDNAAACVVLASGGYPGKYTTGYVISGIENAEKDEDVFVYHAGTKLNDNNEFVTAGGRVLGVTAKAETLDKAIVKAYDAVKLISFKDMHFRKDIGVK